MAISFVKTSDSFCGPDSDILCSSPPWCTPYHHQSCHKEQVRCYVARNVFTAFEVVVTSSKSFRGIPMSTTLIVPVKGVDSGLSKPSLRATNVAVAVARTQHSPCARRGRPVSQSRPDG